MTRLDNTYNLLDKLSPTGNPGLVSYHPIVANDPTNDSEVPSLRTDIGLDRTSMIFCTDCHNNNQSTAGSGGGTEGPHGSSFEPILSDDYILDSRYADKPDEGPLCYKCHSFDNLVNETGTTSFEHREHLKGADVSCINCHDPHGSTQYPHLINFQTYSDINGVVTEITGSGPYPEPTWIDEGEYSGSCWLQCHGEDHDGWSY